MNKYIITVDTNWVGTEEKYAAIAEHEDELYPIANDFSYNNFIESGGPQYVLQELFPDAEEYSDEEIEEGGFQETEYYNSNIELFDEEIHGSFEDYELIYSEEED